MAVTQRILTAISVFVFLGMFVDGVSARTYTTVFPLNEDPISEGGNWVTGGAAGLDWSDVATTNGLAFGLQSGTNEFDDATALLTGIWGVNQRCQATVLATTPMSGVVYEEVELRLRSSLSGHNCTGYEVTFSLRPDISAYVQIIRWNGALGDFDYVNTIAGNECILHSGDTVSASVTNDTITAYINGVPILQGTDTNFVAGSPGLGMHLQGATGLNHDYGFTSFSATDDGSAPPPSAPVLSISGPDPGGAFILSLQGTPQTTYGIEATMNLSPASWQRLGSSTSDATGRLLFTNTPAPGASQQFYRAVWP